MTQSTSLYRFYDANGVLLYVGITSRGAQRWNEHRKVQPWWQSVTRSTVEHFPDRDAALKAERRAIESESPLHNVTYNSNGNGQRSHAYDITPRCIWCVQHVNDGDGYIWIDHPHASSYWVVTHRECDPHIDRTGYWIAVERIRTTEEYHHWLEHLRGKRWFDEDDFDYGLDGCPIEWRPTRVA